MGKSRKRLFVMIAMLICTFALALQANAASFKKSKVTIKPGATYTLRAKSGTAKSFKTSDKSIVTVTSRGVIKGKKVGTATITAKVGKKKIKCTVKVSGYKDKKLEQMVVKKAQKKWKAGCGVVDWYYDEKPETKQYHFFMIGKPQGDGVLEYVARVDRKTGKVVIYEDYYGRYIEMRFNLW